MRPPECNCHGNQCLKHKNSVLRTVGEAREAVGWANNALRKLTILSRMQPKVEPDCTSSTLSKTKIIFGVRKEYAMKCKKTPPTHLPHHTFSRQVIHWSGAEAPILYLTIWIICTHPFSFQSCVWFGAFKALGDSSLTRSSTLQLDIVWQLL